MESRWKNESWGLLITGNLSNYVPTGAQFAEEIAFIALDV